MKIVNLPLEQIKPYWRNARKNDKTVDALKQSIISYGFNQPLVLDTSNVIITGHARFKAVMQLGYSEVPCVLVDLDEKKAKEYRIADNKLHEMTMWNNDELSIEMREIGNFDTMQTYFPNISLSNWLDDSVGFNMKPVTAEEVEKKQQSLETRYDNVDTEKVDIICPHCLNEFSLNKSDI